MPERPGATVPSPASPADIAAELTQAVHDLNARGLFQAAQWAAEQLVGLELHHSGQPPVASAWQHPHPQSHGHTCDIPNGSREPHHGGGDPPYGASSASSLPRTEPNEQHPQYLLAHAYFQSKASLNASEITS